MGAKLQEVASKLTVAAQEAEKSAENVTQTEKQVQHAKTQVEYQQKKAGLISQQIEADKDTLQRRKLVVTPVAQISLNLVESDTTSAMAAHPQKKVKGAVDSMLVEDDLSMSRRGMIEPQPSSDHVEHTETRAPHAKASYRPTVSRDELLAVAEQTEVESPLSDTPREL